MLCQKAEIEPLEVHLVPFHLVPAMVITGLILRVNRNLIVPVGTGVYVLTPHPVPDEA